MPVARLRPVFALCVVALTAAAAAADDWPQWLGPRRDGVWREDGILDRFPKGGPKVRWRTPVGGGYAGPAVADGRVYVTDRVLPPGAADPDDPFAKSNTPCKERVLCLDEASGKVLWTHETACTYTVAYPAGPRATPVVAGGKVFTLGAMGDLLCLDAKSGEVVWAKNLPRDYKAAVPLWGFAAHPLLDGDQLICLVGGKESVVVSFEKDTGKERWRALSLAAPASQVGYCPPMIYEVGKRRQLIIWHPEAVNGLDPETGKVYWSEKWRIKANLTVPTPQLAGDRLLLSSFYNGSMLLKLGTDTPDATVVWRGAGRGEAPDQTDTLHSIMPTPYIRDGHIYGVCSYGELRCLKLDDGKRVWQDLRATGSQKEPVERWANAFLTPHGDRWFLFNEKGDLIIARLSPQGYDEIDRAHLIEPTGKLRDRKVVWSHPAYANRSVYVRNDKEIVCVSLAKE